MAQHDYVIENAPGQPVRSDLNNALAAIVSNNLGAVEPTALFPGMLWLDTGAGVQWPNGRLRQRNLANDAWLDVQGGNLPLTGGTVTGALTVNGLMTLAGGALKFPATQIASGDKNTLDDYHEDVWTPALTFGGGSTGLTYSSRAGYYTKVGRLVVARGQIVLSAKGTSTGAALVGGLPFACANTFGSVLIGYYSGFATMAGPFTGHVAVGQTSFTPYLGGATGVAQLTDANFTATSNFTFTCAYEM